MLKVCVVVMTAIIKKGVEFHESIHGFQVGRGVVV